MKSPPFRYKVISFRTPMGIPGNRMPKEAIVDVDGIPHAGGIDGGGGAMKTETRQEWAARIFNEMFPSPARRLDWRIFAMPSDLVAWIKRREAAVQT
jgi:hypothetical protein